MENLIELIAPCHFGLEAVLKREILNLGYEISCVEDGRVTFLGDAQAIALSNIFLRSAERVLLKVGQVHAETYDELFEGVRAIPWERYLPADAKFWVTKATTIKSKLFSPSDIQSIVKKAIVERLKSVYGIDWFREDGARFPIRLSFMKDEAVLALDTTGESLHKRGYRRAAAKAPISETLAAALIQLTPWKDGRIFIDPFCGSGTFPIEAAMMAANIAPGGRRSFQAESWEDLVPHRCWREAKEEAEDLEDVSVCTDIQGYDIDGEIIRSARENAKRAGVDHLIHFQQRPVSELRSAKKYGFVITNPPYGERLKEQENLSELYREMGEAFARLDSWSEYVITAYDDAERLIGKRASKKRKIYNGMIRTYFYQFPGPRPPKEVTEPS